MRSRRAPRVEALDEFDITGDTKFARGGRVSARYGCDAWCPSADIVGDRSHRDIAADANIAGDSEGIAGIPKTLGREIRPGGAGPPLDLIDAEVPSSSRSWAPSTSIRLDQMGSGIHTPKK